MWTTADPAEVAWTREPLVPTAVLYEYDGPAIFVSRIGPFDALFLKVDELEAASLLLASWITPEILAALRSGNLSVRGAISQDQCWLVETSPDLRINRFWPVQRTDLPEQLMPQAGVGLFSHFGSVPDSIGQSQAFFAVKFAGSKLKKEGMPFSTLKNLVNSTYDSLRKVLTPLTLTGSRSKTFDLDVQPLFGSLVIAVKNATVDLGVLKRQKRYENVELPDLARAVAINRESFFNKIAVVVDDAEDGDIGALTLEQNFDTIESIGGILPSFDSAVETVEFTGNFSGKIKSIVIDDRKGFVIQKAREKAEFFVVSETGVVIEISARSETLIIRAVRGKEVTCSFAAGLFADLRQRDDFHIGLIIRVRGRLIRRKRRDALYVEEAPLFLRQADDLPL